MSTENNAATNTSTTTDAGHTPGSAEGVDQEAGQDQSQRDADAGASGKEPAEGGDKNSQ
jgi:hypothetical protein